MREAWRLKLSGKNAIEIAHELGISKSTARTYINLMYDQWRESEPDEAKRGATYDLARLDQLISAYWEDALAKDPKAASLVLKFLHQRERILCYGISGKQQAATASDDTMLKAILERLEDGESK